MTTLLQGIGTLIFCDETKFYIDNGDLEDAIYYFGISTPRQQVHLVDKQFKQLLTKHNIQSDIFHATRIFREKRPRIAFMNDICKVITENRLHCFCYKYTKIDLFEPTKLLSKFNNDILKFDKLEFQALFYFLTILNTYIRDGVPDLLRPEIALYFDRNVYGVEDIDAFKFANEYFIFKQMTFTEKSKISLLCLPDFFGYIFRKSKLSQNKVQSGDNSLEVSSLTINAYKCLADINAAKLFHFIDVEIRIIEKALLAISELNYSQQKHL
ncbi:MAG TPA: hypothetical protein PLP23_08155 [Panacibacter sp.]|nr:hypothetical protein [Panacibacter sp.]